MLAATTASAASSAARAASGTTAGWPSPTRSRYAWLRDGDPIAGETAAKHTVTKDDAGHALVCEVTAAGAGGADTGPAFPDGPRNSVPPQLGGDLRVGGVVSCTSGAWDDAVRATAYQWLRDGEPIALAAASYHIVARSTPVTTLACRVTAAGLTAADSAAGHAAEAPRAATRRRSPATCGSAARSPAIPGRWDADYALTYAWSSGGAHRHAHQRSPRRPRPARSPAPSPPRA